MIKVSQPNINDRDVAHAIKALKSGRLASGPEVIQFQCDFAQYVGSKYCVATNSGTSALHTALLSLGIGKGDAVIVPSITFFATVEAVLHTGAQPVWCDVDPDTWCMDIDYLNRIVSKHTKAVIPVHLFGQPCDMQKIHHLGIDSKIKIIEDCAQAHGAKIKGKSVGNFGDMGCYSFYATKNMTTIEGGAIVTNNGYDVEKMKMIISHGMSDENTHYMLGYNYRMNEVSAAIGRSQLERIKESNAMRYVRSLFLRQRLSNVSWLVPQKTTDNYDHAWFWCGFFVDTEKLGFNTQKLIEKLKKEGIEVRFRYTQPLYRQHLFKGAYNQIRHKNAEKLSGNLIGLPNHEKITQEDLNKIVDVIKNIG